MSTSKRLARLVQILLAFPLLVVRDHDQVATAAVPGSSTTNQQAWMKPVYYGLIRKPMGSAQYPFEIAGHEGTAGEVQGHPRLGMLRSYGMGGENMEEDANWNEEVTEDRGIAEEILRASQAKRLRNAQRLPMGFRMSANPWVIRQQGQMQRVIIPTR